jgi:hypothetical protein
LTGKRDQEQKHDVVFCLGLTTQEQVAGGPTAVEIGRMSLTGLSDVSGFFVDNKKYFGILIFPRITHLPSGRAFFDNQLAKVFNCFHLGTLFADDARND